MPRISASVIVVICLVGLTQALNSHSAIFNSDPKKNWVVLVAGSDGWWNYRHQSDVCHAYQILTGLGIPKENIITFMYDDIANNRNNPYPGKIFNDYNHKDVYAGVQIDYKGKDVNSKMFMRVMKGDEQLKAAGKKVLQSGPQDNVFVYFTDHGAEGLICFPEDDLYARQMNETITYMYQNKRYQQMVFYIEACHSGSMFDGILSRNIQVYATTAANPYESSFATFCDDKTIDTCLADEYSYNWMTDTETDVNSKMFMRVMKGDEQLKAAGKKVLQSGPQDNVFVYYSDHGAEGLICFPVDDLFARQLNETITYMYQNKRYQQMVFYIEACHSGSMFDGILSPNIQVYVTTAANPYESSLATFCYDKTIKTCLADEYSYNWMTDTETHDTHKLTLDQQFNNVKEATINSHVMKYGDKSMGSLTLDKFQAHGVNERMQVPDRMHSKIADRTPSSRAHLAGLMRSVMSATTEDEHESTKRRLHRAMQMGTIVEQTFDDIITEVEKRYKPNGNQMDKSSFDNGGSG
ncbi:hypothetical protein EG68_09566 [Paragonimus skrjabini miyazakii]|uniref:Hemoglobinase n=1 Tax=Paragonimus skrjabini miyazakii TaxID=59628 RepID=A0A8S9YKW4_9TREM|nr:hypothetical protein EG68_09566 [Paragonimus skrjabini miyazakii]